ncbi:MAG: DNA-formamidopyrimidine glycosylase [Leptospirales bacterium]
MRFQGRFPSMPELPEAETLRQPISVHFSGKLLLSTFVGPHKEIHLTRPPDRIPLQLVTVERIGKILIFCWRDPVSALEYYLVSRLGMAGTWLISPPDEPYPTHTHLSLTFSGGNRLIYKDPRRFGRLEWTAQKTNSRILAEQGPDILCISPAEWHQRLTRSSRTVRTLLLDQKLASGIGNIYASEILFRARISPFRKGRGLSRAESGNLLGCAREILEEAISSGGSSIHSFRDSAGQTGEYQSRHRVYGQEGGMCPTCQGTIRKVRDQNRSLFYCPDCQKRKGKTQAEAPPESFPAFPPQESETGFPDRVRPFSH